jgi:hypothetical protein
MCNGRDKDIGNMTRVMLMDEVQSLRDAINAGTGGVN